MRATDQGRNESHDSVHPPGGAGQRGGLPPLWLPVEDTRNPRPRLLTLFSIPQALRFSVLGLGLALITATLPAQDVALRFVSPPPNRPVAGETRVALEATVTEGARIVRIEVFIDSQRVAVLDKPPYEFV